MKPIIFLCLLFFLTSSPLSAQKHLVEVLGGVNFPNHRPECCVSKPGRENPIYTPAFGVAYSYSINRYIGLRTELFHEERGWQLYSLFSLNPITGENNRTRVQHQYKFLTCPLLIEAGIGKKLRFFVNSGVNISYRTEGRTITDDGGIYLGFIFPEEMRPRYDKAWIASGGIEMPLWRSFRFRANYRYYRSWTTIGASPFLDSILHHNGSILFGSIAYAFGKR